MEVEQPAQELRGEQEVLLAVWKVEPWNVFVGAARLAPDAQSPLAYSSAARDSNS